MFQEPVSLVMLMDEPSISPSKALSLGYPISHLRHHKSAVGSLWVVTGLLSLMLTTNLWIQAGYLSSLIRYGAVSAISLMGWGSLFCLLTAWGWLGCVCCTHSTTHNTAPALEWEVTNEN